VVTCPPHLRNLIEPLALDDLNCRVTVIADSDGRHHILFAQDGRTLQLELRGAIDCSALRVLTAAIPPAESISVRLRSIRRLADLAEHRKLRGALYPPDPRGSRLTRVLQALDGSLAGSTQRDIAIALFGQHRVDRDWRDPRDHLRDQVRRAINRGRALMTGGYLHLLQ